ncbi:uncharacterized protein EMH_0015070 [Eimeria mitis]|uniref:Retrotransposon gag domain-containing protein n=1 Tax=Eimeria mitis TaxID=44415 RepID=U6K5N7_9EIME|nr:uncharacterized protein EMH_0015070 [Eimeria mitis]CDJ33194.1 hypothetical protein EMH_0015070 [Eimeria mitis]
MQPHSGRPTGLPLTPTEEISDIESPPKEIAGHFPEPRRRRSHRESGPTVSRKRSTSARIQDLDAEGTRDLEKPPSKWEMELLKLLPQMTDESRTNSQKEGSNRRGIAATDDGTNTRAFLFLVEGEFRELQIPEDQWGLELRKYLTGKAMVHWELMQRSGTELSDWQLVRERLCARFCTMSPDRMLERMTWNTWRGDHNEYIARFAEIVAQGETLAAEDLVLCFLTNIPMDICNKLNREGTRVFHDWQEAATALSERDAPFEAWRAKRLRYEQEFANAKR